MADRFCFENVSATARA